MKFVPIIPYVFIFVLSVFAQSSERILATADGYKFTARDLSAEAQEASNSFAAKLSETRQGLLDAQIVEVLLETEAAARQITAEKLLETEVTAKVADPTQEQIKSIYDANRSSIGDKTMQEVRAQIIAFLRQSPQQQVFDQLIVALKKKYIVSLGKDVNAPNLKDHEVLANIGPKKITVADFETRNKLKIYDFKADFYDEIKEAIEQAVFSALVSAEAKSLGELPTELLAREITDKLRDYSDAEREGLQKGFAQKLFVKYRVKFLLEEPAPVVQSISTDGDPSEGPADAPVTIVMFSDFQCSACAAVHPILHKIIAEYGSKIRFVVRDFPLVNIHENAFNAALAANAANAQGKYFAYTDILYKNQGSLDQASLKKYAAALGFNIDQFELDLKNAKYADEVMKDIADGKSYGVNGTPTIFVNGIKIRKLSAAEFKKAIEESLSESAPNGRKIRNPNSN